MIFLGERKPLIGDRVRMTARRQLIYRVVAIFFIVVFAMAVGFFLWIQHEENRPPLHVVFVVPNHFRGVLKLRERKHASVKVTPHNGVYLFIFPASGVLDVQGSLPVWQWHTLDAHYENGKTIPVDGEVSVQDDEVAIRDAGVSGGSATSPSTEAWYVVGTATDAAHEWQKREGLPPNP